MACSEGYTEAPALARKAVLAFTHAGAQLSRQPHYDFGMRALKAALVVAGGLKRAAGQQAREAELLARSLRDANVPKLTQEDAALFDALLHVCGHLFIFVNACVILGFAPFARAGPLTSCMPSA